MAAEWNTGFHYETFGSTLNWQPISSQWGAINSTAEMIMPMGNYFGFGNTAGMMLQGNPCLVNTIPGMVQPTNSPDSPETGLAAIWTVEEQYKLEEGLAKYANEQGLLKYIKISAELQEKTVRDVALRCKWMMDQLVESSSRMNLASAAALNIATHPPMMHHMDQTACVPYGDHMDQTACVPYGVHEISSMTRHLLEQNTQAFDQITANFCIYKLQDNIDLFCHTRNNIIAILNDMRNMPGIMSQMPPLPVSIDEDLANSILPNRTQSMMFGSSSSIHFKPESWC